MSNKLNLFEEAAIKELEFDPVAEAEKKLGQNSAASNLAIAMVVGNGQSKEDLASVLGDTHLSCSYDDFLAVVYTLGFEKIYTEPFTSSYGDNEVLDVFWHRDGLLLTGESYNSKRLNSSHVYYNWEPNDRMARRPTHQSGGYIIDPSTRMPDPLRPVIAGYYDGREFLSLHIKQLRQQGKLLAKWFEAPFVWLLNYDETKDSDYDYKAINALKVSKFPLHVRASTGL